MSKTTERVNRYLPLVVWIIFISIASTSEFSGANTSRIIRPLVLWLFPETSEATLQTIHFVVRKLAHFTEYAVLGFFAARAFSTSSLRSLKRRWFFIALFLIVMYALLDEYHQSFVPSRTASIYDSMIDSIGGVAGLLIYARRRKEP